MEHIKCIFCNTLSSNVLIRENGYTGLKCRTCNLIYISPRPNFDEIIDLYGHDNAHATADSHIKFSYGKKLYSKHTLKIINKYIKGRILEIGAGAGYFLNEARKQKFDVYGIEFNQIQADFIKKSLHIPCEIKGLSSETFNDNRFDVIYHCDVISHFYNPIEEFKIINKKLYTKGYVIFETGNFGDVDIKYFKYFTKFQYPDHLFFFGEENLKMLLEQTGFELIKIYKYSILPQLFFRKLLNKSTYFLRPNANTITDINKKKSFRNCLMVYYSRLFYFIRNKLKKFYIFIFYLLRYKLGKLVTKRNRPQTMIIVARKMTKFY